MIRNATRKKTADRAGSFSTRFEPIDQERYAGSDEQYLMSFSTRFEPIDQEPRQATGGKKPKKFQYSLRAD